jgi:hypothetical protein
VLALYSAGNLVITVATVGGLVPPSAAWESAGGVTARALLYVLFFLVGTGLFGTLAVSFQHRYRPRRLAAAPLVPPSVVAAVGGCARLTGGGRPSQDCLDERPRTRRQPCRAPRP